MLWLLYLFLLGLAILLWIFVFFSLFRQYRYATLFTDMLRWYVPIIIFSFVIYSTSVILWMSFPYQIAAEILGMNTKFIPHSSSAPAVLATIRGVSDYIVSGYSVLKSGVENKQLIPIAIYSDKRFRHLPNVPTIVELGYPQLVTTFDMYYAIATSNKVPEEPLAILRAALKKDTSLSIWYGNRAQEKQKMVSVLADMMGYTQE